MADTIDGEFTGGDIFNDDRGYGGQGIAQGGIVDTPDGRWFAVLFQDSGAVGRLPILVPMHWEGDRPVFGVDGCLPEDFPIESTRPGYRYSPLTDSDDFKGELKSCWQFNHEADRSLIAHNREAGTWTVRTDKVCSHLTQAKNTITQRMTYPGAAGEVTVDGTGLAEGLRRDLCSSGNVFFHRSDQKRGKAVSGGDGSRRRGLCRRVEGEYHPDPSGGGFYRYEGHGILLSEGGVVLEKASRDKKGCFPAGSFHRLSVGTYGLFYETVRRLRGFW